MSGILRWVLYTAMTRHDRTSQKDLPGASLNVLNLLASTSEHSGGCCVHAVSSPVAKAPSAPSSFPQSPLQSYVRLRRSPGNRRTPDGPDAEKPSLCRSCLPDSIDQAAIAWNATQPQSPGHTRASWACPTFHKVNGLLNSSAKWQQLKFGK